MVHEVKREYDEEYDKNNNSSTSSKKQYYDSNSDKRSSSREERSRKRSRRDRSYSSSRSRSPLNHKRTRYHGTRENPDKSKILGVFGLSSRTIEDDLVDVFSRYGPIQNVRIVYDAKSGNSRGFGFIYFEHVDDATKARRECNGMNLNGKRIRVDYSITKRPHTPTPGVYMGFRRSPRNDYSKHRSHSSYRRYSRRSYRRSRSYSR